MSYNNTKSPLKPTGVARFQVPKNSRGVYEWSEELKTEFCKRFPKTPNFEMMKLFGIGFSTLQRLKKEWGLEHDMKVIKHKQAMHIKKLCEKNGYYDSIRGVPVNEACRAAAKRKRAEGFHPLASLKETNPRRYKNLCRKRSEKRLELLRRERRRADLGLQQTNIHIPQFAYSKKELNIRTKAKRLGYICGNVRDNSGERYVLYYSENTHRNSRFERFVTDSSSFRLKDLEERNRMLKKF